MYLTDRNLPRYILSRVRVSVRPSNFFIREKLPNYQGNLAASATVYFKGQRPAIVNSGAARHGWLPSPVPPSFPPQPPSLPSRPLPPSLPPPTSWLI